MLGLKKPGQIIFYPLHMKISVQPGNEVARAALPVGLAA
jgi:hypothetical protein